MRLTIMQATHLTPKNQVHLPLPLATTIVPTPRICGAPGGERSIVDLLPPPSGAFTNGCGLKAIRRYTLCHSNFFQYRSSSRILYPSMGGDPE